MGRAGRSGKDSISVIVCYESPLDQYYSRHPDKLFSRSIESAVLNPANEVVVGNHAACAAAELPEMPLDGFERHGISVDAYAITRPNPGNFSIRGIHPDSYTVIEQATKQKLDDIPRETAFFIVHPGAVYLCQVRSSRPVNNDNVVGSRVCCRKLGCRVSHSVRAPMQLAVLNRVQ